MDTVTNLYLIKDLSRLSGHSIYTLKFYLKLGLIKESGRSPETHFRYFDETTLRQLSTIRAWRKQCKSLAEIHQLLTVIDSSGFRAQTTSVQGSGLGAQGSGQLPTTRNPEPPAFHE